MKYELNSVEWGLLDKPGADQVAAALNSELTRITEEAEKEMSLEHFDATIAKVLDQMREVMLPFSDFGAMSREAIAALNCAVLQWFCSEENSSRGYTRQGAIEA